MDRPRLAQLEEAAQLIDLYCKGLKAAGLDEGRCEEENRAMFLVWLEQHIKKDEFWVIDEEGAPASLMHFLPAESEIVSVVTRDGKEGKGFAEALIRSAQERWNYLTAIPVTHGGRGLFGKRGFAACSKHKPNWCWRKCGGSSHTECD
jgi:hypothetical protein